MLAYYWGPKTRVKVYVRILGRYGDYLKARITRTYDRNYKRGQEIIAPAWQFDSRKGVTLTVEEFENVTAGPV